MSSLCAGTHRGTRRCAITAISVEESTRDIRRHLLDMSIHASRATYRRYARLGVIAALLAIIAGVAEPAWAGVGMAVVLGLPSEAKLGEKNLDGNLTITNFNNMADESSSNLVFQITVTPSCGSRAISAECPSGSEDPGVFSIDPIATGRSGTACDGTVFAVNERDPATGQVAFDSPEGFITLGAAAGPASARQCIIDFTFSLAAHPTKNSTPLKDASMSQRSGVETTAYAGAWAISTNGLRPGVGGNLTTLQVE